MLRHGMLFGTLTNERKHRVVKAETRSRMNLTSWDLGALEEVTVEQLREQSRHFVRPGRGNLFQLIVNALFHPISANYHGSHQAASMLYMVKTYVK